MARKHKRSRIPTFRTEAEEAKFWDTHDTTAFLDEFTPAKVTFARPRRKILVSVRLAKSELDLLRQIAARKGLGYGSLLRLWLKERLLTECSSSR